MDLCLWNSVYCPGNSWLSNIVSSEPSHLSLLPDCAHADSISAMFFLSPVIWLPPAEHPHCLFQRLHVKPCLWFLSLRRTDFSRDIKCVLTRMRLDLIAITRLGRYLKALSGCPVLTLVSINAKHARWHDWHKHVRHKTKAILLSLAWFIRQVSGRSGYFYCLSSQNMSTMDIKHSLKWGGLFSRGYFQ